MKANTRPKYPPAVAAAPRDLAECWLPTTEDWAGSYYVCHENPRLHAPKCPDLAARVTVKRHLAREPNRDDTPDTPGLWRYRVTVWGTDDLMRGRDFDSETEALSCFLALCRHTPITFAFLDTLGLVYE